VILNKKSRQSTVKRARVIGSMPILTGPDRIDVTSSDATVSIPLCLYPQKVSYNGTGAVTAAASYSCK
jgi:hypothetical protein